MFFGATAFATQTFSDDHEPFGSTTILLTGVRATFGLGTVTVTGTATVTLDGVRATFAVGTPKLTIWNGVDDSNTDIWTVVPTG